MSFATGITTILIAHVMFCLSFVVVTVKARIASLDPRLEQAAMDLYADEKTTFWKVTFPQVLPGIVGASLLAFSLSFDDFIITNFNSGSSVTFPMFVWGSAQRGTPPPRRCLKFLLPTHQFLPCATPGGCEKQFAAACFLVIDFTLLLRIVR